MKKSLIAVIHLPPLPGSPRSSLSREEICQWTEKEASTYYAAGIRSMILENHGDAPFFPEENPREVIAFLAVLGDRLKSKFDVDLGINILRNDAMGAMAAAAASGSDFIRVNVLNGIAATDQGLIAGRAHELMRLRRNLTSSVRVWADIQVKFATQLYQPSLADLAKSCSQRAMADAIIISGSATGSATNVDELRQAKMACPQTPVFAGSGVTCESLADVLSACDGAIVGSTFKEEGYVENPIDPERLEEFMDVFKTCIQD